MTPFTFTHFSMAYSWVIPSRTAKPYRLLQILLSALHMRIYQVGQLSKRKRVLCWSIYCISLWSYQRPCPQEGWRPLSRLAGSWWRPHRSGPTRPPVPRGRCPWRSWARRHKSRSRGWNDPGHRILCRNFNTRKHNPLKSFLNLSQDIGTTMVLIIF